MKNPILFVLTGYTGVGKTSISIQLAKIINAEIVSCDSLLVYKLLDIGTAKPQVSELQEVTHHCIDLINPDQHFDISQYIFHAKQAIQDILARKKNVLIVGGSGFYLKSYYYPIIDNIIITSTAEQFVNEAIKKGDFNLLIQTLLKLNNDQVSIDLNNIRRVSSALKRCLSSGLTIEQMRKNFQKQKSEFSKYSKYTILLTRSDDDLQLRLRNRIYKMIASGLITEVEMLVKNNQLNNINCTAIGYREVIEYLSNKFDLETLPTKILHNTLKLVKKQKTWFKKQIPIDLNYDMTGKCDSKIISDLSESITLVLKSSF